MRVVIAEDSVLLQEGLESSAFTAAAANACTSPPHPVGSPSAT